MGTDLMGLYERASTWTGEKIAGTTDLTAATPCDEWQVRDLLNHMLETQRYFVGACQWPGCVATKPEPW